MKYEYRILTAEDIEKAESYIPLLKKMELVSAISEKCFETLNITANSESTQMAMPPVYREDTFRKSRYLMGIFAKLYLKDEIGTEGDDEYFIAVDEYDKYAGGHIFEQLNRFKSDAKLRDKCFDMFNDYKDICWRLDNSMKGLMTAMNDPVSRAIASITTSMTPDSIQNAVAGFETAQHELENLKDRLETISEEASEEG